MSIKKEFCCLLEFFALRWRLCNLVILVINLWYERKLHYLVFISILPSFITSPKSLNNAKMLAKFLIWCLYELVASSLVTNITLLVASKPTKNGKKYFYTLYCMLFLVVLEFFLPLYDAYPDATMGYCSSEFQLLYWFIYDQESYNTTTFIIFIHMYTQNNSSFLTFQIIFSYGIWTWAYPWGSKVCTLFFPLLVIQPNYSLTSIMPIHSSSYWKIFINLLLPLFIILGFLFRCNL